MVKLSRKSDRRNIVPGRRTFFAGCKTFMERRFFEAQNEAELFIDVQTPWPASSNCTTS
jgi:hypothetical protein